MTHGDAFLQAVLAEPDDDAPRLIYADWLEERGDPRGAFIRLQCALERIVPADLARPDLEDEAGDLLHQNEEEWTAPLRGIASEWRFRRGFVEEATVAGDEFLARGDDLFSEFPIIRLRIRLRRGQVGGVAASSHLGKLRTLDVRLCYLRDSGVEELLASPHLKRVTALNLAGNDLEGPAIRALLELPLMGRLTSLNLSDNGSLGVSAARRLAQSPAVAALQTLGLSSTNIGPAGLRDLLTSTFLRALTSLQAGNILHSGTGLPSIIGLTGSHVLGRLTALDLSGFPWPGGALDVLGSPDLGQLSSLCLSRCNLGRHNASLLMESWRFSDLSILDLTANQFGPEGLQLLAASPPLAGLTILRFGDNSVRDAGAQALAASSYVSHLIELDLHKNGIGGPGIQALARSANLANLTTLDLSDNYVGLESVRALAASPYLSRLKCMRLKNNQLDDEAARLLAGSPHVSRLSILNMDDNALSDGGLYALLSSSRLTRLTELYVRNNGIGSSGAERLAAVLAGSPRFARLRKLDLRGNPLGGAEQQLLRQRFGARIELG
jgi:uncharacterized protein (TIGR02996 family)